MRKVTEEKDSIEVTLNAQITEDLELEPGDQIRVVNEEAENTDLKEMREWFSDFDNEDLIVGTYWWAADYHSGQSSEGYEALSLLSDIYTPGRSENGPESGSGAEIVYDNISSETEALQIAKAVSSMDESTQKDTPVNEARQHSLSTFVREYLDDVFEFGKATFEHMGIEYVIQSKRGYQFAVSKNGQYVGTVNLPRMIANMIQGK